MSTYRHIDKEIYRPENYLKDSWEFPEYILWILTLINPERFLRIYCEYAERLLRVGLSPQPCPNCTICPNSSICSNSSLCPLCPDSRMNPESVTGITPLNPWLSAAVLIVRIARYVQLLSVSLRVWRTTHFHVRFVRISELTRANRSIKVRLSGWKNPAFGWFEVRYRTLDLLSQIRQIVTLEK